MSSLSSETKTILIVIAIGLVIHLFMTSKETTRTNSGQGPMNQQDNNNNILKATSDTHTKDSAKNTFVPMDETDGKFSSFKGKSKAKRLQTEEMFNVDNLLPKEKNPDWFDSVPEPINVKDKRLININRPMGVNTVGTSRKNASSDMRGSIPSPKFTPPWGISSIEPDPYRKPVLF